MRIKKGYLSLFALMFIIAIVAIGEGWKDPSNPLTKESILSSLHTLLMMCVITNTIVRNPGEP